MENNEETTEYTFPSDSKEYFEHLLGKNLSDGEKLTKQDYRKIEEAYNKAHDIRKFEIELYWKRSTYFWTFISVLVAICGVVSAAFLKDGKFPTELRSFLFCTSILGYFISLHFLITCVSGKQWQENWERHIDILESYFAGNLYKLNLVKGKLRYSISLSNEIIVAAITFAWIIIIIYNIFDIPKAIMWKGVAFLIVITAAYLWMSLKRSKNTDIDITFNIRTVKSANIIGKSNHYLEQNSTKWVNRIITGVVIVLLLFSTLYYNSDTGKQMELGSLTDWISAGANTFMAGAAVYAAFNAKDWLSPKLNDRKVTFADEIIDGFCRLQQEASYLNSDVKNIINTDPDIQGDKTNFAKRWEKLRDRKSIYRKNIISLRSDMARMELWGLKPKNKNEFDAIISAHLNLSYTIENALSIGAYDTKSRMSNSFEYDGELSKKHKIVRASHNKIIKHYSDLFVD